MNNNMERVTQILQTHGLGVDFLLAAINHFIVDRQVSDDCGDMETQILSSLEGYISRFEHSEASCNYCGRIEVDDLTLTQVLDHTVINDGSQMITVCGDCECEC